MAMYSVISTLTHRARIVFTKPELLSNEIQHPRKAMTTCKYSKWALDKLERKFNRSQQDSNVGNNQGEPSEEDSYNPSGNATGRDSTKEKYNKGHIVIHYTHGLGGSIKKDFRKYDIQTHFKGNRTIKNILVKPKDKDPLDRKSRVIYWHQCEELVYDEEYIGESFKTFGERYKEYLKEPSPNYGHSNHLGHSTNPNNFTIIGERTMA